MPEGSLIGVEVHLRYDHVEYNADGLDKFFIRWFPQPCKVLTETFRFDPRGDGHWFYLLIYPNGQVTTQDDEHIRVCHYSKCDVPNCANRIAPADQVSAAEESHDDE